MSPLYEYECPNGHHAERLMPMSERVQTISCHSCMKPMKRSGIELPKRARVVGGTIIHHRNEQRYTRGIGR